MAKRKGSVPVPNFPVKETKREPKKCRYCGCDLNGEITDRYSNVPGEDSSACVDCIGMFEKKLGFMEWDEPIPDEIIQKAERVAQRHPELAAKVEKWKRQYRV